jgi:hypothetical protein
VPVRGAPLAALVVLVGLALSGCGGDSSDDNALPLLTTTTTPLGGGPLGSSVASRNAMMANTTMSRKLLSGRFRAPAGFTVLSVNPSVPLGRPADGAVRAVVTSPTGVEYVVMFGPTIVPCVGANCPSASMSVPVGSANPSSSSAIFAPDIGRSAECGFDADGQRIGCDTIVDDEYISVAGNGSTVSTTDAVAILRAAVGYVQSVSGSGRD